MTDDQLVRLIYALCLLKGYDAANSRRMANEVLMHPSDSVTGELAEPLPVAPEEA